MTEHVHALRRPTVTLILVAVALAAVSIGTGPADAAFPGGNGRIAFAPASSDDIVSVNTDGTGRRLLIAYEDSPTYPPDGKKIAFGSGGPETGDDI